MLLQNRSIRAAWLAGFHLVVQFTMLIVGAAAAAQISSTVTAQPLEWLLAHPVIRASADSVQVLFELFDANGGNSDIERSLVVLVSITVAALFLLGAILLANHRLRREIGERRHAELRLQNFAASASDWLWEMDRQLRFCYFSERFAELTGVPPSALLGKTRQETGIPNVDRAVWDSHLDDLANHRPFRHFVHPRVKDSGQTVWLSVSGTPAFDTDGTFIGYRGTGADVTEQVEARERLIEAKEMSEQAARVKSEFLANMSHEIRTPINGVLGMNEILLATDLSEKQRRCANTVRRSAESLLRVINDVLDFSKMEAGKLEIRHGSFDLRELVEDIGDLFAEAAHNKGIELVCAFPVDAHVNFRGDVGRIRQILTNLVGNAIKFTEQGEVVIRAQEIEDDDAPGNLIVRFEVRDTGVGIVKEKQQHIFSPFAQVDGSANREFSGTGLGLAISSQLAQMMGGQIGVESVSMQGSSFWFTVPLIKELTRASATLPPEEALQEFRILVVDDNATNIEIYTHQLSAWKADFDCATSGAEALEYLRAASASHRPYSIVVLDMHMPGMDGMMLARAIADDPSIADVRRVMLSSIGDQLEAAQYQALGIEAYLTKPVRQAEFYNCIVSVLDSAHSCADTKTDQPRSEAAKPALQGRVLLVEDNLINQEVACAFLSSMGLEVELAEDGLAAIEMWSKASYDLVLMDCQMPKLDGFEATIAIRRIENEQARRRSPIVALTANAMQGDREQCVAAGMDDYLTKPFTESQLRAVVSQWLLRNGTTSSESRSRAS